MVSKCFTIQYLGQNVGRHFCTNCRATYHGVVLNVTVFIKHLLFSFLLPQGGIDKGKMHSKKISLILQDPLVNNQSVGRWMASRTGMVGEVMNPSLYYGATQVYTYLQRKLEPIAIRRGGGAVHTGAYHCVPGPLPLRHSCTSIAAPSPLHRGSPRGGNITTTRRPIKVDLQYHSIPNSPKGSKINLPVDPPPPLLFRP